MADSLRCFAVYSLRYEETEEVNYLVNERGRGAAIGNRTKDAGSAQDFVDDSHSLLLLLFRCSWLYRYVGECKLCTGLKKKEV